MITIRVKMEEGEIIYEVEDETTLQTQLCDEVNIINDIGEEEHEYTLTELLEMVEEDENLFRL